MSPNEMRLAILIVGVILLAVLYWTGRKPRGADRRAEPRRDAAESHRRRVEPTLGDEPVSEAEDWDAMEDDGDPDRPVQGELEVEPNKPSRTATTSDVSTKGEEVSPHDGRRPPPTQVERIVTLFVVPRNEATRFRGSELVVAAEKAGLSFGDLQIFHRVFDGKQDLGPIFSVASMVEPGRFDMSAIDRLETPGLSVFMTIPGPLSALDAWDAMLPTAQRLAELLDGKVIDEDRNALGRQGIAYIRDDLRAWDRSRVGDEVHYESREQQDGQ